MQKLMNIHFAGSDLLTGLPEYRNGGLLIDMGLMTLKEQDLQRGLEAFRENSQIKGQPSVEVVPLFSADDDVIVEWRAATVGFLDELLLEVNSQLGLMGEDQLTLPQLLEAGSWKVGVPPTLPKSSYHINIPRVAVKLQRSRDQTPKNHRL